MKLNSPSPWVLSMAIAALVLPGAGAAQGTTYPALDRRHDEALAAAGQILPFAEGVKEAARLHAAVADQRTADDTRRFECLETQAALLHHTGDIVGARRYLELAAEQAEANGDSFNAARVYIDAAMLADRSNDLTKAGRLALRAARLSRSPVLPRDERELLTSRLGILSIYQ